MIAAVGRISDKTRFVPNAEQHFYGNLMYARDTVLKLTSDHFNFFPPNKVILEIFENENLNNSLML